MEDVAVLCRNCHGSAHIEKPPMPLDRLKPLQKQKRKNALGFLWDNLDIICFLRSIFKLLNSATNKSFENYKSKTDGIVRQILTRLKVPRSHKSMKRRFETTL